MNKNKIAKKLGYISLEEYTEKTNSIAREYERKLSMERASNDAYKNLNTAKITEAISGTRFVKVKVSTPRYDIISDDLAAPNFSVVEKVHPPNPEYVTLSAKIDIAGMKYINSSLERFPMELEYFVNNFMGEFENRIRTAMSMSGVF